MRCPECGEELTLKDWWKKHRLDYLLEYQAKFVAGYTGIGIKHTSHPKYKQSERLINMCGFKKDLYEGSSVPTKEVIELIKKLM